MFEAAVRVVGLFAFQATQGFFGIIISMYHNDHAPRQFHVSYGEAEAVIAIDSLAVIASRLPPRVLALVLEWGARHRDELRVNWELARQGLPLRRIVPLDQEAP